MLVRASYFPNWDVSGAEGPYRVAPNLMVVIPTDTSVELTYGRSGIELFSIGLTVVGLIFALLSRRFPRVERDDGALWDLTGEDEQLPSYIDVLEDARSGLIGSAELAEISDEVAAVERAGLMALGASFMLIGWSFVLFVIAALGVDALVPGADKLGASLVVLGPAAVGIVMLVFAAIPRLVRTRFLRTSALGPARTLAESVEADRPPGDIDSW